MSKEKFEQIITAIIDGRYSWACILLLRFAGYDPLKYIPYATYNRLIKENLKIEKDRIALEEQYQVSPKIFSKTTYESDWSLATDRKCDNHLSKVVTSEEKSALDLENKQNNSFDQIYQCQCSICQQPGDLPEKKLHDRMNLFLSRLNEQQKRWYVALEANKLGHGGTKYISQITGIHPDTIRRGRKELDNFLEKRPVERVRLVGGGRRLEKKNAIKGV